MWDHGLISRVNQLAETAGFVVGEKLSLAALHFVGKSSTESDAQLSARRNETAP
jgi:hypothetical protein